MPLAIGTRERQVINVMVLMALGDGDPLLEIGTVTPLVSPPIADSRAGNISQASWLTSAP
jgi:hypothetical protein